jgi:hypothetical protein
MGDCKNCGACERCKAAQELARLLKEGAEITARIKALEAKVAPKKKGRYYLKDGDT